MNGPDQSTFAAVIERLPPSVSVWVEDWSPVKVMVDELARDGMEDWRSFFEKRIDMTIKAANIIDVIDVNEATLTLYGAASKADVIESFRGDKMSSGEMAAFRDQLIAFAEGEQTFTTEAEELTMADEVIRTRIYSQIAPEGRHDWSLVYSLIEKIPAQEQNITILSSGDELLYWESIKDSRNPGDFEAYLETFPCGLFASLARRRAGIKGAPNVPVLVNPLGRLNFDQLTESAKENTRQAQERALKP